MAGGRRTLQGAAGAVALILASTALADVKAGEDAWNRGDFTVAVQQWEGPAEQGDPDAQFHLAQAYRLGRGAPRDLAKAELLFGKAAAQGHIEAGDFYGLMMFDRGERTAAMRYIRAAAGRGDARAQYLLGIAHFNGDLAPKDWVRAYALMTLAQSAGLPQAAPAMTQMDQHIPLAQRQAAATLAAKLGEEAETNRRNQLAAADLGSRIVPPGAAASPPFSSPAVAAPVKSAPGQTAMAPPRLPEPTRAAPAPAVAAQSDPVRPAAVPPAPVRPYAEAAAAAAPAPAPAPAPARTSAPAAPRAAPAARPAVASGPWRVQLGAFGVPGNADALWARVKARPELAGHPRANVKAGAVTKLQATGFASREAANRACSALAAAGITCLAVQD